MSEEIHWHNLGEIPYFRAILRAVESRLVQQVELPDPILDLGCGDGHFTSVTYNQLLDFGLYPSIRPIREAQKRNAYKLLVRADGALSPFKDGSFAGALSNSMLEHISQLDNALQECSRVLRSGAPFVFIVPNPGYKKMLSIAMISEKVGLKPLAIAYRDWFKRMSRTINLFDEVEWERRLDKAGFEQLETKRHFSPSTLKALEWGHYFGAPCLYIRWLTGRWILVPNRWNLQLTERFVRQYAQEAPSEDGTYNFYLAQKR